MRSFWLLTPINPNLNAENEIAINSLLKRLHSADLQVISFEDVLAMGNSGFMSCSCPVYLHHAWCKHSFVLAKNRKIILEYPPTLDPRVIKSSRKGRIKKTKPGESLLKPK